MSNGARDERRGRDETESGRSRTRFRLSTISIGIALVAILGVAYPLGYLLNNANATRAVAVFAIGVVSFLGMLTLRHQASRTRRFDSDDVRVAVTTAFVMVYFAIIGIFLFSTNEVQAFAQSLVDNLTSLFGIIVAFYFASSAVVEYGRTRSAAPPPGGEESETRVVDAAPLATGQEKPSLEAEVQVLRKLVGRLLAEREPDGVRADEASQAPPPADKDRTAPAHRTV